jgi:uncharacterized membrane protein YgcG
MNDLDARRYAARRAVLASAIRDGNAPLAARAAARLRLPQAALGAAEFVRARDLRRTLGRAIVNARVPERPPQPLVRVAAISAPVPSRRKYAYAAVAVAAAVLLFLGPGSVGPPGGTPAGAPPTAAAEPERVALLPRSRGRTIVAPPEIVAVQESPTPAPTAQPSASPDATAAAAATTGSGPARTGTPAPSGRGGTGGGGGSGGGGGGGLLPPTPTPTPAPTIPAPTPPVPPAGFGRFNVVVLDASTGRPIPDACVVVGTASCAVGQPHTDASGRWTADVPVTNASTPWDMQFIKTGYFAQSRSITLSARQTVTFQIRLRPSS